VEVDDGAASDAELAAKLSEACPVDIFAQRDGNGLEIVQENLDECVLCRLCLDASPDGAVRIIKLYDEGALLA
jgi:NAD-dependent dihydropyrimidine dehydrogenase PreA subunit